MKIAFSLSGTDAGRSGIGTYVKEMVPRLARVLANEGHSLTAFGSHSEIDAYGENLGMIQTHAISDLVETPALSALWHSMWFDKTARSAGADVILWPAANRRVSYQGTLPTVSVVHDLAPLRVKNKYGVLRDIYARNVILPSLSRATRLVAVSKATRDDLHNYLGDQVNVDVAPNGVDGQRFHPRVKELPVPCGLTDPYLVYVSRLEHPGKNHIRLLEAFAQSEAASNHVLALAGQDWGAKSAIEAKAHELGVAHRVKLLGRVSDQDLPPLIAHADAAIMVGLHEGFGLPALEALACGTNVLASSTGALPEVVGDLGVLCDPFSVDSIANGLQRILLDEDVRQSAELLGPAWAALFSWDNAAKIVATACIDVGFGTVH